MTKMPVAGVIWQTVHYLVGFERLGYDVYYVEAHARTPSMLMEREEDDSSTLAADFIARIMERFDLGDRWAFHALHADGRCYGMSQTELNRLYRSAALIINLHGGTQPLVEHSATDRLVYLETDPVQLQVELHDQVQATIDFLEPHCAFFTFGENYGKPSCALPVSDRFDFRPTRQPVVIDFWQHRCSPGRTFTTVGNWRQQWRDVRFGGNLYSWSKHQEFAKFLELPKQRPSDFELALSSCDANERRDLQSHGWRVRDGLAVSTEIDRYRDYISGSRGEFTVAKEQNVRLRTGWFSDRSATYLAAGRPVIAQETGFSDVLPTREGLFGFSNMAEAIEALDAVEADHGRHCRAAEDLARNFFSSDVVLGRLLDDLGMPSPSWRSAGRAAPKGGVAPLPDDLDLVPTSRRPTTLSESTVAAVVSRPLPADRTPDGAESSTPTASILVVTLDNLVCNRMCLESVLASTDGTYEVIVVDNASTDGTPSYLEHLARNFGNVSVITNNANRGFAPAVNQGLAAARGDVLVVLNNDTVVPPGWLSGLMGHLRHPNIGMVGPVTNEAPNEARVSVDYRTYGEFVAAASSRAVEHVGETRTVDVATMFCVAFRRDVYRRVGPLDERFEVGMFEDDDYSRRVQAAGLQVICAEDVLVHHFGEVTLGTLVATGEHARIFTENRRRLEEKWACRWKGHLKREDPGYRSLVRRVGSTVAEHVAADAGVAIVSKGDDALLDHCRRQAWHFPQAPNGGYAGHYPADGIEALNQVQHARRRGAQYLVVPATAFWWLEHYLELGEYVSGRIVVANDDCVICFLDGHTVPQAEQMG